jgi:hypothetical protein
VRISSARSCSWATSGAAWRAELDRARYGDVDDEHGPLAGLGGLEVGGRDDALAGGGARQHDVGGRERRHQLVEADSPTPDVLGQAQPALGRAVGDDDVGDAGPVESGGDADAHLAGSHDEHPPAGEAAEPIGDHFDGGVADRRRAAADRGLGAGPLAGAHGVAEQQVERRPHRPLVLGHLPRAADLTEDLALADHRRVQPGGDLEEVPGRGVVVLRVQVRVQLVGTQRAELTEEVADLGVGRMEPLGDGVHLDAVARAEHRHLAQVVPPGQPGDGLGDVVRGDRQPLEDRQRSRAVVDPDDDDRHTGDQPRRSRPVEILPERAARRRRWRPPAAARSTRGSAARRRGRPCGPTPSRAR